MQNLCVRQGFSSFFFQPLPYSLMADAVDHFKHHELVSQKTQGPSLSPIRRLAACQLDQTRFGLAVYLRFSGRTLLRIQRSGDPFERASFAYTLDRTDIHVQVLGNLLVNQTFIGLE